MESRVKRVCNSEESIVSKLLETCPCGDCCSFICPLEDHENEEALHNILYDNAFVESHENEVINVSPHDVKFYFDPLHFKEYKQLVNVHNRTRKGCRVHVLDPDTSYFKLTHETKGWIQPGQPLRLRVTFTPDELREYHDVLRIHCPGDHNLMINLSARPEMKINFPIRVDLGNVPLGEAICYKLPIPSVPEKKFVFAILPLTNNNPCVDVHPLWGSRAPGQNPIDIIVTYRPLKYITLHFAIQIYMPEVCKTPFVVNFLAYTKPGLRKEMLIEGRESIIYYEESDKGVDVESVESEIILAEDASQKRKEVLSYEDTLLKKLGDIPLLSLHGVNCIMYAKLVRTHAEDELRGALNLYLFEMGEEINKCRTEFLRKADAYRKENHYARTHHRPKIGPGVNGLSKDEITAILIEREEHWRVYKDMLITTPVEKLLEGPTPRYIRQRTLRAYTESQDKTPFVQFNDDWFVRYQIISPFIQAARSILLKLRMLKVLNRLKKLTPLIVSRVEMLIEKEKREANRQRRRDRKEKVERLEEEKKLKKSPKA